MNISDTAKKDKKRHGRLPLHIAIAKEAGLEKIKNLIKNGHNPNEIDLYERTPLHDAAKESDNLEVIQLLINTGAGVDKREVFNRTALHFTAENKKNPAAVIKKLLKNGASIDSVDKCGNTPLHDAGENENIDAAIALIDNGANLDMRNKEGQTPREFEVVEKALAVINLAEHQKAGEELQTILTTSQEHNTKINALNIVFNNYYINPPHLQDIDSDKNKEELSEMAIPLNKGKGPENRNTTILSQSSSQKIRSLITNKKQKKSVKIKNWLLKK